MGFSTPDLPYDYAALEPFIDEQTMHLHHDKHHVGYTTKLNAALEGSEYASWPIEKLLGELGSIPESIQTAVRNNGGGHFNHSLFWEVMAPNAGGAPGGVIGDALADAFGSFDAFKKEFTQAATTRFGSGWAWLVLGSDGLAVYSTANQDTPLANGHTPILGLDVWEHAYYLKYQNRRPEYVEAFFSLINWTQVEQNFQDAQ